MHQAHAVLPALLSALAIDMAVQKPWLFGHSEVTAPDCPVVCRPISDAIAGAVVVAPHILVEDVSVSSIASARTAYLETELRQRLSKYHDDPDSAFWGWNEHLAAPAVQRMVHRIRA